MWHPSGLDPRGRDRPGPGSSHPRMRRNLLIVLGSAALVWGVLAIALGSASLTLQSGARARVAASPSCLPATLEPQRQAAGNLASTSRPRRKPAPPTPTRRSASWACRPRTIREVSVVGARSGSHSGRLRGYSQGDGASFVPDTPFDAGEQRDRARRDRRSAGAKQVAFGFRVDTPYPTAAVSEFPNPPAAPADYQSFDTMPGVQAPILTVTVPDRDPGGGRHPHDQRARPGPVRAADLHAAGPARVVRAALGGRNGREPERADLRRPARPDVVEGARALARLRPGRRHRHELPLPDGRDGSRAATACTADLHDFQIAPRDVAYITAYNPIRCDLRR